MDQIKLLRDQINRCRSLSRLLVEGETRNELARIEQECCQDLSVLLANQKNSSRLR
jgi:hypothetical protein